MKSLHFNRAKKSLCGRTLRRLLGEEKGAVAMEYIVIALLVAAAVVGLVMVFSGNLRNMFAKTNDTLTTNKVSEVKEVADSLGAEKEKLKAQNDIAIQAGDGLGGDYSADHQRAGGSGGGN